MYYTTYYNFSEILFKFFKFRQMSIKLKLLQNKIDLLFKIGSQLRKNGVYVLPNSSQICKKYWGVFSFQNSKQYGYHFKFCAHV